MKVSRPLRSYNKINRAIGFLFLVIFAVACQFSNLEKPHEKYKVDKFTSDFMLEDSVFSSMNLDQGAEFYYEKSIAKKSPLYLDLNALELPVLLPEESIQLDQLSVAKLKVISQNSFQYTAISPILFRDSIIFVEIIGASKGIIFKDENINENSINGNEYDINYHEEGLELNFSKYGVAYRLSVFCGGSLNNAEVFKPPCQNENFIKKVFSSLVLAYFKE